MELDDVSDVQRPSGGDEAILERLRRRCDEDESSMTFTDRLNVAFAADSMPKELPLTLFGIGRRLIDAYVKNFDAEFARSKAKAIANNFAEAMECVWHEDKGFRANARSYFLNAARNADLLMAGEVCVTGLDRDRRRP